MNDNKVTNCFVKFFGLSFRLVFSIFIAVILFSSTISAVYATTYYVDATDGSDSNLGTAEDQAWQTIDKVNTSSFNPGDNIYFKRGEIWREQLTVPSSGTEGNVITFGAYGSGDKPLINGGTLIAAGSVWISSGVNGEYYRLLGTTAEVISSDILVVRGQQTGISSYTRMVYGTKDSLGEDQYNIFLSGGSRYLYYKPLSGHTPDEYDFEWTSKNSAIDIPASISYVNIDNIRTILGYILYNVDQTQGTIDIKGSYNTVSNCEVSFSRVYGIYIKGANNTIDSCTVNYNRATGVFFGHDADNSTISNSTITYNGSFSSDGVNDRGGVGVQPDGVTVTGNTIGNNGVYTGDLSYVNAEIQIFEAKQGYITKNYIFNAARKAISLDASTLSYGWVIQSNVINRWGLSQEASTLQRAAIAVLGMGNTSNSGIHKVENNTIYSDDDYILYGIDIGTPTSSDYIKDSFFRNNIVLLNNNSSESSFPIRAARGNLTNSTIDFNIAFGTTNAYHFNFNSYLDPLSFYSSRGYSQNDSKVNPVFTSSSDFTLQATSPGIDAGVDVGLTTDYLGNSIYGIPDIGAYEYQPPYTIGVNEITTSAAVRIYGDEKFRNKSTPSDSVTADLSVTLPNTDLSQWLDIEVSTWENSETHHKVWTESTTVSSITNIVHTVGDLEANKNYNVKVDDVLGQNITGDDCNSGVCKSNSQGEIAFTYTGSYSTHTFDVEEGDNDISANPSLTSPTSYTRENTKPTLVFKKATDEAGISSYKVELDSGKNKSYSISGIPASGDGSSDYVWKDDDDVKVEFTNENDSDANNDEIKVYFKGLDDKELSEGKHTWKVTAYDSVSNSTIESVDFYIDKTNPSLSETAIVDLSSIISEVTYNLPITNRMPSFSGLVTDIYQGSEVTNENGSKDTFNEVSSGPKTVTLKMLKLKEGQDSSSSDAEYEDYSSEEITLEDIDDESDDKKTARFYITTPFPLVDGYYKVQLSAKDEAGNTVEHSDSYLSLNNQSSFLTNPLDFVKNFFTGGLDLEFTKQETIPIETDGASDPEKDQEEQQGYSVKVKVTDDQNNPVAGAKVTIHSKVQETTSDENGIATFENVEPGDHRIIIAYDGFEGEQKVTLTGDVREFSFDIKVTPQNPLFTPQVMVMAGVLVSIIALLSTFYFKSKSRNS